MAACRLFLYTIWAQSRGTSKTIMVKGGPGRHQDGMPTVPQWRRGWPNTCRTISPICRDAATSRTNKLPARPEKCGTRPA